MMKAFYTRTRPHSLLATSAPSLLLVVAVVLHLTCCLPSVWAQRPVERGVPVRPLSQTPACGTKFVDPSSSALLADIVLKGSVDDLRQASPIAPLLYKARVHVHKVYKGQELLTTAAADSRNNSSSARGQPGVDEVQVERFGPRENRENCVGQVDKGQVYLFFLRVKDTSSPSWSLSSSSSLSSLSQGNRNGSSSVLADSPSREPPLLANTALPYVVDVKTMRKVKKVLCPDCSSVPVIRRLRCKHCALKPTMKRPMSANHTKTVKMGKRLSLRCVARGSPKPSYTWIKNGIILYQTKRKEETKEEAEEAGSRRQQSPPAGRERRRGRRRPGRERQGGPMVFRSGTLSVRSSKHHSLLVVKEVTPEDQGTYVCLAANEVGEAEQSVQVLVKESSRSRSRSRSRPSPPQPDLDPPTASPGDVSDGDGPCAFNPCYNGGSCFVEEEGGYDRLVSRRARCDCLPEYHGSRCQFRRRRPQDEEEGGGADDDDEGNLQTTLPPPVNNNSNNSPSNDNTTTTNTTNLATQPTPQPTSPHLTPSGADGNPITPQPSFPPSPSGQRPHLTKKQRRKLKTSPRERYGSDGKASKSGVPQLKVSECPEKQYCFNGGTCKVVVKIQRRFCECPRGFTGRRCERRF